MSLLPSESEIKGGIKGKGLLELVLILFKGGDWGLSSQQISWILYGVSGIMWVASVLVIANYKKKRSHDNYISPLINASS